LTRQKSSVELNPGEVLGKMFDRFKLSQGFNLKDDDEQDLRIAAFIEILGTARIPVKYWDRLYQKAMVTRGQRRARGEKNPFFITPEELIAEYDSLMREIAQQPINLVCPQTHDNEEDRLVEYMFGGNVPVLLPCHLCRKDAHQQRIAERVHQKKQNTLRIGNGEQIQE